MTTTTAEIHAFDTGTNFDITVYENGAVMDVSAASTKQFVFRKTDLTIVVKDAAFITDGKDGKLRYTTLAGDLDQKGVWRLQIHLTFPTGQWHSNIQKFTVHENIRLIEETVTIAVHKGTLVLEVV
jgi:hypothetical protein